MPESEAPVSEELRTDLEEILVEWVETGEQWWPIPPDVHERIRLAVLRDFSLAGVRARGATHQDYVAMGKLGGRPRKGETAEEARLRRIMESEDPLNSECGDMFDFSDAGDV